MTSLIHSTAIIQDGATVGANVHIGPYCIVGPKVILGDNAVLKSHVVIDGRTTVGSNTTIHSFASIGNVPQDLKYNNEDTELIIGKNNVIREYANINIGTVGGGGKTIVGDNCLIMVGVHIAHDCIVGNNVILANHVTFGGHVIAQDYAVVGGLTAVHQFVRIGMHSMVGGASGVRQDVLPYSTVVGNPAKIEGINILGLRRRGFSKEEIANISSAMQVLFMQNHNIDAAIEEIKNTYNASQGAQKIIEFASFKSSRGLCRPEKLYEQN